MIWFTCSKCGKTQGRPENSIGSMVFCECGQGNRVPWESTIAEPPPQPVPTALPGVPASPTLAPLMFESPGGSSAPPAPRIDRGDDGLGRRRRGERRDPNYCFNHSAVGRSGSCEDCGEAFCANCLVTFEGATLCSPCKNFRVRTLELPPRNSTAASLSLVIALVTGGLVSFCLLPFGNNAAISILSLLLLLPQLVALGLGIRALYLAQQGEIRVGGQALAVTGVTAAALCITLTLLLNLYGLRA
jgi:hypothetical protein